MPDQSARPVAAGVAWACPRLTVPKAPSSSLCPTCRTGWYPLQTFCVPESTHSVSWGQAHSKESWPPRGHCQSGGLTCGAPRASQCCWRRHSQLQHQRRGQLPLAWGRHCQWASKVAGSWGGPVPLGGCPSVCGWTPDDPDLGARWPGQGKDGAVTTPFLLFILCAQFRRRRRCPT